MTRHLIIWLHFSFRILIFIRFIQFIWEYWLLCFDNHNNSSANIMVYICSNGWKGFICIQIPVACNGKYHSTLNHILNQEKMASFYWHFIETTLISAVETCDLETVVITHIRNTWQCNKAGGCWKGAKGQKRSSAFNSFAPISIFHCKFNSYTGR